MLKTETVLWIIHEREVAALADGPQGLAGIRVDLPDLVQISHRDQVIAVDILLQRIKVIEVAAAAGGRPGLDRYAVPRIPAEFSAAIGSHPDQRMPGDQRIRWSAVRAEIQKANRVCEEMGARAVLREQDFMLVGVAGRR